MDLQDFNSLNIYYKWKLHQLGLTNLDIVSPRLIHGGGGGGEVTKPVAIFIFESQNFVKIRAEILIS